MKLTTEQFTALPHFALYFFAPPFVRYNKTQESCLITLKSLDEIRNSVHASDGFIYDAKSLQWWLNTKNHIIPGLPIDYIWVSFWPTFLLRKTLYFTIRILIVFCKYIKYYMNCLSYFEFVTSSKSVYLPKTQSMDASTQTLMTSLPKERIRSFSTIPSKHSAFTKFQVYGQF